MQLSAGRILLSANKVCEETRLGRATILRSEAESIAWADVARQRLA